MKRVLKFTFLMLLLTFLVLSFSLSVFAQKYGPIKVALLHSEEHSEGKVHSDGHVRAVRGDEQYGSFEAGPTDDSRHVLQSPR